MIPKKKEPHQIQNKQIHRILKENRIPENAAKLTQSAAQNTSTIKYQSVVKKNKENTKEHLRDFLHKNCLAYNNKIPIDLN